MEEKALYWIWLTQRRGLGPTRQRALLERFGRPDALYAADDAALARAGIPAAARQALLDKDLGPAQGIWARCRAGGIGILTLADPAYPARLRLQEDAPILLYRKGHLPPENRPVIALVGARRADPAALALARRLGRELAACGGRVATGMAKGIDAQAAEGALEAGGTVIGVLGCGPDLVYPRENAELFARVTERGCLLSEYPPGTAPNARNFPVRNRIISALSDGVAVVRATEESGALITARWAARQGREVYAVPGAPDDPLSRGCNALLREGALAAESGWDLLRRYEFRYPGVVRRQDASSQARDGNAASSRSAPLPREGEAPARAAEGAARQQLDCSALPPAQRRIAEALSDGPLQLDALIDKTGLPAAQVLAQLTLLQIKHTITQRPGKLYELSGG